MDRPAHRAGAVAVIVTAIAVLGFAAVPARSQTKLTDAQIKAAFAGKTFEFRSTKTFTVDPRKPGAPALVERTDGGWAIYRVFVRTDGSIIFRCTTFDRAGGSRPCSSGLQDAGVWNVAGDQLCWQWTGIRASQKFCFETHRAGANYTARQISGPPSSMNGATLEFK